MDPYQIVELNIYEEEIKKELETINFLILSLKKDDFNYNIYHISSGELNRMINNNYDKRIKIKKELKLLIKKSKELYKKLKNIY